MLAMKWSPLIGSEASLPTKLRGAARYGALLRAIPRE